MTSRRTAARLLVTIALVATTTGCGDATTGSTRETSSTVSVTTTTTAPEPTIAPTTEPAATPALPEGPAWSADFPDPFVLVTESGSYAYGTTSGFVQVQRLDATGLTDWMGPSEVLPELPAWAAPLSAWAPAILSTADGFTLYYTAQVTGTDRHCIAVATSDRPTGPFVESGAGPLVCPEEAGGAIDPSPFVDVDGQIHLLWKNDGITLRRESAVWSQRLSHDGTELAGDAVRLVATDQAWEFPHVEAPSMALVDGTYWLAYSGNWWNQAAYGVGLARCDGPAGPCTKPLDRPVLTSRPGAEGPGGAEFFRDGTGRLLVAYHAWVDHVGYPGARALWLAVVDTTGGVPSLGG